MWTPVSFVAALHKAASDGSVMERAVNWFLFWPLLAALHFLAAGSLARSLQGGRSSAYSPADKSDRSPTQKADPSRRKHGGGG